MNQPPLPGSGTNGAAGSTNVGSGGGDVADAPSALFLALQNPSLSRAAAVLLRTMSETGTISSEDAALMSSFLASCDEREANAGSGYVGNTRTGTDIGIRGSWYDNNDDGSDEVQAAAAARTITAQLPECEWEPNPIRKKMKRDNAANGTSDQYQKPAVAAVAAVPAPQQPIHASAPAITTQPSHAVGGVSSTMHSVRSEYTHERCLSDPASCVACQVLDNPLNKVPIEGRESHTSDLAAFDRHVNVLQHAKRPPRIGPYSAEFWSHIRTLLEAAVPAGFEALSDKDAVSPKGPADCAKFLSKVVSTASINPIHPNIVAEAANLPLGTVLNELFCAARLGLVDMQWAPLCERCGSVSCSKSRIEDLPNSTYCGGCQYKNTVDCLEKIKVIFTLKTEIFYVLMENFACTPSKASMGATLMFAVIPATSTGSGFRYSVGCGGDLMFCPSLEPGRYRMHCPVAKTDNYLFVQRKATDDDEPCQVKLAVSDMVVKPGEKLKTFYAPHGKLHFDIYPDTRSFLVLWIQKDLDDHTLKYLPPEERPGFTSAKDIIEFPAFQVLFRKEVEQMLLTAVQQMKQKDTTRSSNTDL